MIFCITEDRTKTLWLGTDQGISLYNPYTENFSNFNLKTDKQEGIEGYISKIFIDNQDRVWILAGNGLFLFNPTENKLYGLNHKLAPYSSTLPRALFVEKDGTAYIGLSEFGVVKYNINTNEATFLAQSNSIPTVICNYKNNYLLLGTMDKGLFLINKQTGACESIQIDEQRCSDVYVREIEEISDSEYWVGTQSGIYILKTALLNISPMKITIICQSQMMQSTLSSKIRKTAYG